METGSALERGRGPSTGRGWAAVTLGVALALGASACGGKSTRTGGHGDDDDPTTGGTGASGVGGAPGKGGSAGKGGSTGKGGATPDDGLDELSFAPVEKIDLLFMIDNSISMADKQRTLAEAIPVLVNLLVTPPCVDADGNSLGLSDGTGGGCPAGFSPEFRGIRDIHVGIITSSLGNHGGDVCVPDPTDPTVRTLNDAAQLIPTVGGRTGLYSWANSGFLVWDPTTPRPAPDQHPGLSTHETNPQTFIADFTTQVQAAGEHGCGYEASLEAWYRFLIDPEPINNVTQGSVYSVRGPVNGLVLEQRAAFLRPNSLLAVVMLTDENDCSIVDEDNMEGWLVGKATRMPRSSAACSHPEDPDQYRCCRPCAVPASEGCPSDDADPQCSLGPTLTTQEDSTNLRCFKQTQRFGLNLLYPTSRYIDGLTSSHVQKRDGTEVPNPIFTPGLDGTPARDRSMVFLAGIVGVPWQDLSTPESWQGQGLQYLSADELAAEGRWDVMLGDPGAGIPPTDPFMLEQVEERPTGAAHPLVPAETIRPSTSTNQQANHINGHEQNILGGSPGRDDLQYACTFPLLAVQPCTMENQDGCDCNAGESPYNRPLCEYASPQQEGTQSYAKAYPGLRQLEVLKGFGSNAVVASICAKNVVAVGPPESDPSYGYNPAIAELGERFAGRLASSCFPRPLSTDADGRVPCRVIETRRDTACACDAPGRTPLSSTLSRVDTAVRARLADQALCGGATGIACDDYCLCEIQQFADTDLDLCQIQLADPGNQYGYCYVDPDSGVGNPQLVAECPATSKQLLRFMGNDVPAHGSLAFLSCSP